MSIAYEEIEAVPLRYVNTFFMKAKGFRYHVVFFKCMVSFCVQNCN